MPLRFDRQHSIDFMMGNHEKIKLTISTQSFTYHSSITGQSAKNVWATLTLGGIYLFPNLLISSASKVAHISSGKDASFPIFYAETKWFGDVYYVQFTVDNDVCAHYVRIVDQGKYKTDQTKIVEKRQKILP